MMTIDRARQILASYGGQPARWPESERAAMQKLLATDAHLRELQRQAQQFDDQLAELFAGDDASDCEALSGKIMDRLPVRDRDIIPPNSFAGPIRKLLNYVSTLFEYPRPAWALASVMSVLLVIGVVQFVLRPTNPEPQFSRKEDVWSLMADELDNSPDLELLTVLEPELAEDDLDML